MKWKCGRFLLELDKPKIMGIINVTPDSFFDGNTYSKSIKSTLFHAEKLLKEGADILDIGGESTRPGSNFVPAEEEWKRLSPILKEISTWNIPISLDTRKSAIMYNAITNGYVDIINDISALSDINSLEVIAKYENIGLCIMHMQGNPSIMQINPTYDNVKQEVINFLADKIKLIISCGINQNRIVLDPGIGFGKNLQHNISLLKSITSFKQHFSLPMMVGVSRKSMLGEIIQEQDPNLRKIASVVILPKIFSLGADIVRVHDVKESIQALNIWIALEKNI